MGKITQTGLVHKWNASVPTPLTCVVGPLLGGSASAQVTEDLQAGEYTASACERYTLPVKVLIVHIL